MSWAGQFGGDLASAVDDPFRPLGEVSDDAEATAGRPLLMRRQLNRKTLPACRIANSDAQSALTERERNGDPIPCPASVAYGVGHQLTGDEQRLVPWCEIGNGERLFEQRTRLPGRGGLGAKRPLRLELDRRPRHGTPFVSSS